MPTTKTSITFVERSPTRARFISTFAMGAACMLMSNSFGSAGDCCDCLADINKDGTVLGDDLGLLLAAWGTPGTAESAFCEDVNGDGSVDGADLGLLLAAWQSCVPNQTGRCKTSCPASDHDCCTTGGAGCTNGACCEAVCAIDTFCCNVVWDGACVNEANSICGLNCENPACPNPDHDCFSTGTPGCSDEHCCNNVCVMDSFCCAVEWDNSCVNKAISFCPPIDCWLFSCDGTDEGEPCGAMTNDGCNVIAGSGSDCCFGHGGIGCNDARCQAAVCAVDSFCCGVEWDDICAAEAVSLCPTLCAPNPPEFGTISCGETICATAWAFDDARDTDWYVFNNPGGPQEIVLTIETTLMPMIVGKVDSTDCATATAINPFMTTNLCGVDSLTICLDSGVSWLFVAPTVFTGFPCGAGTNDYILSVECTGAECDPTFNPACPNPQHDCCVKGGPGCSDEECCYAVCVIDTSCCLLEWDLICVDEAISMCGASPCEFSCTGADEGEACGEDENGGCNVPASASNCCLPHADVGCDDAACQSAVCAVNSFCCNVAWDGTCAAAAANLCATLCPPAAPEFGSISCGETICATAWADGDFRDTDWYVFENDGNFMQGIVVSVQSAMPMLFGAINSTDCETASAVNPFATTDGRDDLVSLTMCVHPGVTWLFAAPVGFAGYPCGSGLNDYVLSVECTGVDCGPCIVCSPACPNPKHDCATAGGPGCSDEACCYVVCTIDAFCCTVAWDLVCGELAQDICKTSWRREGVNR